MKTIIMIALASLLAMRISAQSQAETFIKEAQGYLAEKNYKQAQLSLQDAINDINNVIGNQISEAMPKEINGLKSVEEEATMGNAMGFMGGGIAISKKYRHPTKKENEADVEILANSPMLATINMYMNNPAMLGQGYKSVRVGTIRAILKTETEDYYDDNGTSKPIRSSEIQIPLSQTMITINAKGFASEAEELAFANKLELDKLKVLLGE